MLQTSVPSWLVRNLVIATNLISPVLVERKGEGEKREIKRPDVYPSCPVPVFPFALLNTACRPFPASLLVPRVGEVCRKLFRGCESSDGRVLSTVFGGCAVGGPLSAASATSSTTATFAHKLHFRGMREHSIHCKGSNSGGGSRESEAVLMLVVSVVVMVLVMVLLVVRETA